MTKPKGEPGKVVVININVFVLAVIITAIDYFTDGDLNIYNGIRHLGNQAIGYLTQ